MNKNYYEVLGVSEGATAAQIKYAYKRIAQKHHPDKDDSLDGKGIFLAAKEAFEVLSDPVKRANYDKFGHLGVNVNIDIDREAIETLRDSFVSFIDQIDDIETIDVVATFKQRGEAVLKNNSKKIESIIKSIHKSEKVQKKIHKKSPDGVNIFMDAVQQKINGLNRDLFHVEQQIKITERILELLDDYEYDFTRLLEREGRGFDIDSERQTVTFWNPTNFS